MADGWAEGMVLLECQFLMSRDFFLFYFVLYLSMHNGAWHTVDVQYLLSEYMNAPCREKGEMSSCSEDVWTRWWRGEVGRGLQLLGEGPLRRPTKDTGEGAGFKAKLDICPQEWFISCCHWHQDVGKIPCLPQECLGQWASAGVLFIIKGLNIILHAFNPYTNHSLEINQATPYNYLLPSDDGNVPTCQSP